MCAMTHPETDIERRLRAVQIYLRAVIEEVGDRDHLELAESLPLIAQIQEIDKQMSFLRGYAYRAAFVEMRELNVAEIETPEWLAECLTKPSVTKTRNQEVAEVLLKKISDDQVNRMRHLKEEDVRSIVAVTYWNLIDSLSVKWSSTKLKRKGINLKDYSEEGTPQNKVVLTLKERARRG